MKSILLLRADKEAAIARAELLVGQDEFVSEQDLEILSSDAAGIVQKISNGIWTSTLVNSFP